MTRHNKGKSGGKGPKGSGRGGRPPAGAPSGSTRTDSGSGGVPSQRAASTNAVVVRPNDGNRSSTGTSSGQTRAHPGSGSAPAPIGGSTTVDRATAANASRADETPDAAGSGEEDANGVHGSATETPFAGATEGGASAVTAAGPILESSGNVRSIVARWVMTAELELVSAAHFGGQAEDTVDMSILRDRASGDGSPLLTGASLAGALRGHLTDCLLGYRSAIEPREVTDLFGGGRGDDAGQQSPLILFDSVGHVPASAGIEVRDGVAIDPATGTAEAHKKYDLEVLPAGTAFPLRLELVVNRVDQEEGLVGALITALSGLARGEIALGARRSRGLGEVETRGWRAVRYDMTTASGWLGWLRCDPRRPIAQSEPPRDTAAAACRAAWPKIGTVLPDDRRRRVVATVTVTLPGGLLVRSDGVTADSPDVTHLMSGGRYVMPGTSLAGALRARALRIARLARPTDADADAWVARLFGPRLAAERENGATTNGGALVRPDGRASQEPGSGAAEHRLSGANGDLDRGVRDAVSPAAVNDGQAARLLHAPDSRAAGEREEQDHPAKPSASRLRVTERVVQAEPRRTTRVRIDRFTQGTVPGALFDEEPALAAAFEARLELRSPVIGETGLLLLLLKDVLTGDLPLGGTTAVGRGVATGTGSLVLDDGTVWQLDPATSDTETLARLKRLIDDLYSAPIAGLGRNGAAAEPAN